MCIQEIQELGKKKPVIASMSDLAASGGYYISMAAHKIVAEVLTLTGENGIHYYHDGYQEEEEIIIA